MAARSSFVPASSSYNPATEPYAPASRTYPKSLVPASASHVVPATDPYAPASASYVRASSSVVPASIPPASTQDPRLFMKGFFIHVAGSDPVGPVSANQVARGIKAGKIPAEASIQWQGDLWWKGVYDEPAIIAALKTI
jgi:hypothetical protein